MREKEEAEMIKIRAELNEAQKHPDGDFCQQHHLKTQSFDIAGMVNTCYTGWGVTFFDYLTLDNGLTAIAVCGCCGERNTWCNECCINKWKCCMKSARVNNRADIILRET